MGLFGKIFDKKECSICGGEIGLLGNRKLADGNLCKNCASKLSPYMTDRRESTVEEIRAHLAYREANASAVRTISPTRTFGTRTKVYLDERQGKFIVTRNTGWRDANPDVIALDQVTDVTTDVKEHRSEMYHKNAEGKSVSFNPPRYKYTYEFDTTILVNSPYFSEIHFEFSDDRPEHRHDDQYREYEQQAEEMRRALMPSAYGQQVFEPAQQQPAPWKCASCGAVNTGKFCENCGTPRPNRVPVTFRCDKCGWVPEDPANPPKFCPQCGDPFNMADARR